MIFAQLRVGEAEGAILAHSLRLESGALKKGHRLMAEDIAALVAAGISSVAAARLEPEDVPEDEAASRVATAAGGPHTYLGQAFTGRRSIYAEARGLAIVDRARVDGVNLVDESLTLATVAPFSIVEANQMVATVKVNPLSAPAHVVKTCENLVTQDEHLVRVAPLLNKPVGLVSTRLPGTKERILDKTVDTMRARVESLGSRLVHEIRCGHDEDDILAAVRELIERGARPILIFGASAIVDRRDVVPQAIAKAGGHIDHFGMPVDPGNLTMLAHIGDVPILGLPGSARSPRIHGCDILIQRLLADVPIRREDIMRLGAGGLLKEIPGRPHPRDHRAGARRPRRRIGAVVLAAGQSRRMGRRNKLLAAIDGTPMLTRVVDTVLTSTARPVVVVTGHEAEAIKLALAGREVQFTHNPRYAEGLSSSLGSGLAAMPEVDGVLICLGDMPRVTRAHLDRLIAAFAPERGRSICVPTCNGKRGNPVLWSAVYFAEMRGLAGDVGARHLMGEHSDEVHEVAIDDEAIFVDVDTPDALSAIDIAASA